MVGVHAFFCLVTDTLFSVVVDCHVIPFVQLAVQMLTVYAVDADILVSRITGGLSVAFFLQKMSNNVYNCYYFMSYLVLVTANFSCDFPGV